MIVAVGHRKRLTKKIRNIDLDNLNDHELLEFLLFGQIPRKDTNGIAQDLLKKFGTLKSVLEADPSELFMIPNMTERAAVFLPTILKFAARARSQAVLGKGKNARFSPRLVARFFRDKLCFEKAEKLFIVALSRSGIISEYKLVKSGDNSSISLDPLELFSSMIGTKCTTMVIVHNHPIGKAYPSDADILSTKSILETFRQLNVDLVDHIIVSDEKYFSFASEGILDSEKLANLNRYDIEDRYSLYDIPFDEDDEENGEEKSV